MIVMDTIIMISVLMYFFLRQNHFKYNESLLDDIIPFLLIFLFIWILLSGHTKLYNTPRNLTYTIYLERLFTHIVIFLLSLIIIAKVSNNEFLKQDRFIIAGGLFIGLFFTKTFFFFLLKYIRTLGINYRNVMFLANDESSEILKNTFIQRKDYGFRIFEFPEEKTTDLNALVEFWKENGIHSLFLPASYSELGQEYEREIFRQAEIHKVRVSLIPDIIQSNYFSYDLEYISTQPVFAQTKYPLDYFTNFSIKRVFDIVFSIIILVGICTWLFPIIAILIKLNSKGSVFFVQERYGFHNQVFKCIKFRTMYVNDESSNKTTMLNDKRITKIGHFLRKSSLDEMPQFFNVLLGEMSVVGPRPHMILVDDTYKKKIGRYTIRSFVKPGITGLAQVNGLRGDNGDMEIEMHKRILADTFYVKNWSFILDLVIIFKTALLVIKGDKNAI